MFLVSRVLSFLLQSEHGLLPVVRLWGWGHSIQFSARARGLHWALLSESFGCFSLSAMLVPSSICPTGTWIANRKQLWKGKPCFQAKEMHGPWVSAAPRKGRRCSQGGTTCACESLEPKASCLWEWIVSCRPQLLAGYQLSPEHYRVNSWLKHIRDEKVQLPDSTKLRPWLLKAKKSLLLISEPSCFISSPTAGRAAW